MKLHIILLMQLILVNSACSPQVKSDLTKDNSNLNQKTSKIDKIQITEQTRGTNRSIIYLPENVTTSVNGVETQTTMSPAEWENIKKETTMINLSKISSYESTTTGRFSDRALASKIIITSGNTTYESATFDEGIPPKELEGLYRLLKNKSGFVKKPKMH